MGPKFSQCFRKSNDVLRRWIVDQIHVLGRQWRTLKYRSDASDENEFNLIANQNLQNFFDLELRRHS